MRNILFLWICLSGSVWGMETIDLPAPRLPDTALLDCTVGLRPCRKTGVRLEVDLHDGKVLIHNYGYGGSGITLSLGGAQEASRLVALHAAPSDGPVAVLGAGIIGLTTAWDLSEQGYDVRVYADAYSPHLISDVAMGIWSPPHLSASLPDAKKQLLQKLLTISRARFEQCLTASPPCPGVRWVDIYRFCPTSSTEKLVTIRFDNQTTRTAEKTRDILIEPSRFMAHLRSQLQARGVPFHNHHFAHIDDVLSLSEPILVNCMSGGSKTLFNDAELFSVRGHLVSFKPEPGCDYFLSQRLLVQPEGCPQAHFWVNIYASPERIHIGGVTEKEIEDPQPNPVIVDHLIRHARALIAGNL